MSVSYKQFNFQIDDINQLFDLYEYVYEDNSKYKQRWKWEYQENPQRKDLRIFIAEDKGKIIGATTRLPFKIKINEKISMAAFNVNSMIHQDYRRKGIMEHLYKMASEYYPVLYSKGTVPGMYKLLMKMNFHPVYPNTFLTSILSPLRWLLWRLGMYKPKVDINNIIIDYNKGFYDIGEFDFQFDKFWERISPHYSNIVVKDSAYMNWRYLNISHNNYRMFYRKKDNKIVSMAVISQHGTTARIVDILWDKEEKEEPSHTLKYIKTICKKCGFLKILCWATMKDLREALRKNLFFDKGETFNFSVFTLGKSIGYFSDSTYFHFVEGDGDSEYLSF